MRGALHNISSSGGVCSLPQSCCDTGTAASPAMLLSEGSLHFATRSFSFFCHPNRLTRVFICSQLPERRFCKKLSPVPAGGADPIPAPPWSHVPGSNLSLGHKTSGHKGISFCQSVQCCGLGKKRDSSSSLFLVTAGEGTWECLERSIRSFCR